MKSFDLRNRETFLRNAYYGVGLYDIPVIYKQRIEVDDITFIGFHNTKARDVCNNNKTVHFFKDDNAFEGVWREPERYIDRLRQYKYVLTPDFSMYTNMPAALQIYNNFRRQWCGAYWQSEGIKVIPVATWAGLDSYDYCFDGIEEGSVVAVTTMGSRKRGDAYMKGFRVMCERLRPSHVICYCEPFDEMAELADIIMVPHEATAVVRALKKAKEAV